MPLQLQNTVLGVVSRREILLCPEQNYVSPDVITRVILVGSVSRVRQYFSFKFGAAALKRMTQEVAPPKEAAKRVSLFTSPSVGTLVDYVTLPSHKNVGSIV